MQIGTRKVIAAFAALGLVMLVLDPATTVSSGIDGVEVCMRTLVPSMLPFLVLSSLLTHTFSGTQLRILKPISRFCGIPYGAEALMVIGLLGGYPMGAKMISDAYSSGNISRKDALHMLAFCNNAGPAFIFGVLGALFSNPLIPWITWLIHIVAALITGYVRNNVPEKPCPTVSQPPVNIVRIIENSAKTMGVICTWVILFRIVIGFLTKRFLNTFPFALQALMAGILELANGIIRLGSVADPPSRFVICTLVLSFGGLCVLMQTASVTSAIGIRSYFPGKVIHCILSTVLAGNIQFLIFTENEPDMQLFWLLLLVIAGIAVVICRKMRKNSRFYNSSIV